MSPLEFILGIGAAAFMWKVGWPYVKAEWAKRSREGRIHILVEERMRILDHADALRGFSRSHGGASPEDKAEVEVLREHATARVNEINREIAAIHMESIREESRKALRERSQGR